MSHLEELGRVLAVDDDPQLLAGLQRNLRRLIPVVTANGGDEALALLRKDRAFSIIICDMRMPGMDGAQFFAEARLLVPDAVRILLTGQADLAAVVSAINQGRIYRFIAKPVDRDELMKVIGAAMAHYRLQQEEQRQLEASRRNLIDWAQDMLSLASVEAWGRAVRVRRTARALAEHLGLGEVLSIEAAAVIWLTGDALGGKCSPGLVLEAMKGLAGQSERMQGVHAMLEELAAPPGSPLRVATRVVQVARWVDDQPGGWIERIDGLERHGRLDPRMATGLRELEHKLAIPEGKPRRVAELVPGMRITAPLRGTDGALLVPPGVPVNALLLARLSGAQVDGEVMVAYDVEASSTTPLPFPASA